MKTHVVMRFAFSSMKRAWAFSAELDRLKIQNARTFQGGTWMVVTDSRCLAYAADLHKFVYGGAR
jgi:hypothetical protein